MGWRTTICKYSIYIYIYTCIWSMHICACFIIYTRLRQELSTNVESEWNWLVHKNKIDFKIRPICRFSGLVNPISNIQFLLKRLRFSMEPIHELRSHRDPYGRHLFSTVGNRLSSRRWSHLLLTIPPYVLAKPICCWSNNPSSIPMPFYCWTILS